MTAEPARAVARSASGYRVCRLVSSFRCATVPRAPIFEFLLRRGLIELCVVDRNVVLHLFDLDVDGESRCHLTERERQLDAIDLFVAIQELLDLLSSLRALPH